MATMNQRRAALIRERTRLLAAHERHLEASVLHCLQRAPMRFALAGLGAGGWLKATLFAAIKRHALACGQDFIRLTLDGVKTATRLERKDYTATAADLAQEAFLIWLETHALERAVGLKDSVVKSVKDILVDAAREGDGTETTARKIAKEISGEKARVRARRIARTETHTAANKASVEAAGASGLDLIKEWGATEDHRTRPSHAEADGQRVEMGEQFTVGGALMDFPGDPNAPASEIINCRCTLLFWPK